MAWGLGLHPRQAKAPRKREGDGRSPAGVFALGQAFGVADELPAGGQNSYPYLQTSPTTYCVEDTRSTYYNQIVDLNDVGRTRWERWSPMKRPDGLFDWGIVVRQNRPNPVKSAGSCVFLHIWRGPHQPTAGCTAMARDDIEKILRWLDGGENPVLVQLPDPIVDDLRLSWALP